jgi:hypothetical protein
MDLPQLVRSDLRGEGNQGFGSWKRLFKGLDKIDCRKPKGFEETFHLDFLLPDAREEVEEISRVLGIGVEADMEGLIPVRNRLPNGLENALYPSKDHPCSAGEGLQGRTPAATPGTLHGTSPSHREMMDGRLERIHPKILLFGNSLDIERQADVMDVGEMIFQQREVGEGEVIQVFLRGDVGKRIDKNSPLPSPGEVGNGEEIILPSEKRVRQFQNGNLCFTANDPVDPVKIPHDLFMEETGGESSQEDIGLRKGSFDLLNSLHHIETLMVPVEVHRNDSGSLLPEIFDDSEIVIFNPLHTQVYNLGGKTMALEKVGQSEESHR